MLKRRLLAAAAAILMAGVGAVLLMNYVRGADDRAMAGMETANVLVVTSLIPKGTSGDGLAKLVTTKSMPVKALATGTLSNLDSVVSQVTTVDLQPGEQLLSSRFVDPVTLEDPAQIKIPAGMQQLSIAMERPRMLGSVLTPGSTVGIFVSLAKEGDQPAQTHLILHKVLVTKVGDAVTPPGDGEDAEAPDPAALVMVTFAVKAPDAEKIVFGTEHGRLYLSLEPSDAAISGTRVVDAGNVYQK